ncbi:glycosyltransferase family 39 protein [Nicoliella spurrieriana]|uniref:Glycosyltransferase family 39 protein n=1 Tax=Nicoliella spurrieriana TaxID=2925830 RepID=A0A976RSZ7_9LACO|nr:glycosyltransferase family 39 protein [Nicoliella spurrieriana]UQS87051.1 glycosyltransferase family 39 protein [Nicoliella spurrieriana]
MNHKSNQKLGWPLIILIGILSLFITAFITTTSPLFAFNNSWDGNTMFTVGKGLWHGLLPYRDLFDQRGPLMYLMNSFAALISYRTFLGVYLFEALTVCFDIILSYRIINLKFSKPIAFASSFTIIPIVFNGYFFENGELPESLVMPLMLGLIYTVLKNNGAAFSDFQLFWQGVALSIVFWTKYTLILPWVAFFGWILIAMLIKKQWHPLLRKIAFGAAGFFSISLALIIFFGINGALFDLFKGYFYMNFHYYPKSKFLSIHIIYNIFDFIFRNPLNTLFSFLFALGFAYFLSSRTFKWQPKLMIALGALMEVFMIVGNAHSFRYYFVGLGCFLIFISMGIANLITILIQHWRPNPIKVSALVTLLAIAGVFITNPLYQDTILFPHNQSISANQKSTVPFQIKFAKIINRSNDRSILNYNNLDVGLYTATATLPQNKYFAKLNLKGFAPMMDSQNYILNHHKANFVVFALKRNQSIWDPDQHPDRSFKKYYRLVAHRTTIFQNQKVKYLLYKLRS